MYIEFKSKKLRKRCEEFELAKRAWGKDIAKKLVQRLQEIQAQPTLKELCQLPAARCHALTGKRKAQFAVDLVHPYRLVFEPIQTSQEIYVDQVLDHSRVERVKIIEVVDYHD